MGLSIAIVSSLDTLDTLDTRVNRNNDSVAEVKGIPIEKQIALLISLSSYSILRALFRETDYVRSRC